MFKCILCGNFSYEVICKDCMQMLKPSPFLKNGVLSFYDYEKMEYLLKMKYKKFGNRVFKILAKYSFLPFAKTVNKPFFIIPVDDRIEKGFSHTAVLAKSMQTQFLTPVFSVLYATNRVHYAGKSLEYRLENPRNFRYTGPKYTEVILVDDILTTGTTLKEAENCLKEHGVNVALKIVLCDLKQRG